MGGGDAFFFAAIRSACIGSSICCVCEARPWFDGCGRCKKNVDGWSLPKFKGEALKAYSGICRALASGNQNNLRQVRQDEE